MGRFLLAWRAFWATLFQPQIADQIRQALAGGELPKRTAGEEKQPPLGKEPARETARPRRSEALTLLSALQREARLVDLVQEPLDAYSDEQIGAAARSVLRDSAAVLARFFALEPVLAQGEGEEVEVPAGYDPARFQLAGQVSGSPPHRGRLRHAGWRATACNLPAWTGSQESALVVAPAEVEIGV